MARHLTFFEHLEELRKRLLICVAAVLVATAGGYLASDRVLQVLLGPLVDHGSQIYFFSPVEAFLAKIKVAFLVGFLAASPVVAAEIWLFISPAFYPKERKFLVPLIFVTSFLFFVGTLFCFLVVVPPALNFLVGMQPDFLKPLISITSYLDFLIGMSLGFGVAFNLPVFIMAFVLIGFFTDKDLNRYQRHAIVLILVAAAILTPGPDVASQLFLAVPMIVLYELSVLGAMLISFYRLRR